MCARQRRQQRRQRNLLLENCVTCHGSEICLAAKFAAAVSRIYERPRFDWHKRARACAYKCGGIADASANAVAVTAAFDIIYMCCRRMEMERMNRNVRQAYCLCTCNAGENGYAEHRSNRKSHGPSAVGLFTRAHECLNVQHNPTAKCGEVRQRVSSRLCIWRCTQSRWNANGCRATIE